MEKNEVVTVALEISNNFLLLSIVTLVAIMTTMFIGSYYALRVIEFNKAVRVLKKYKNEIYLDKNKKVKLRLTETDLGKEIKFVLDGKVIETVKEKQSYQSFSEPWKADIEQKLRELNRLEKAKEKGKTFIENSKEHQLLAEEYQQWMEKEKEETADSTEEK